MLKVLLVDDEVFIAQGLEKLIDWQAEGYEIAAVCQNGQEALDYLRENRVDLVIADVMMPVMTGLELLETVKREKISDASFVILSGYGEFAFAQQALRYGCMDYLLKPIERDDLLAILRRSGNVSENARMEQKYEQEYLTRRLIALLYGRATEQDLSYIRAHMRLSPGVRYIEIELAGEPDDDGEPEELAILRDQVYQNCRQFLQEDAGHCVLEFAQDRLYYAGGLLYCDYMAEEKGLTEAQFIQQLHRHLCVSIRRETRFIVGRRVQDMEQAAQSYESAMMIKSLVAFRSQKPIYWYEHEFRDLPVEERSPLLRREMDDLVEAIERGEHGLIETYVQKLFSRMKELDLKRQGINVNFHYLLFRLVHLASGLDSQADQEEILQMISAGSVEQGFLRGSSSHLTRFACEYADYLGQLRHSEPTGILKAIEREIRENYAENLTLQDLGKKYYINSSYLGQIFRKAYGQSFKNYLMLHRVNVAAQLLLHTDRKIGDIAESVGYRDIDYFIAKFIEIKGCTPSRYRKSMK